MFADSVFWVTYFVICVYSNCAARTGKRCIEGLSGTFTVQLQCSAGEWIHVEQEAYGDGDNATCRLKSAQSCSKVLTSNQNGLVVNCNGKQSCHEAMSVSPLTCNVRDSAEVKYNCIKGSMDMCNSVSTTANGSLYLHSPGFPDSVGVNSSCVVRITGQNIQVTLVEQRKQTGFLNISGDGKQLWTSVDVNQYNRVLPGKAAEVKIVYDNHDQTESDVWIRVAASGQMNITSKRQILETTTIPVPTSTLQTSRSQGTTSQSTSDTETTAATTPSTTLTSGQMNITSKREILETTTIPVPTSTLQTSRSQSTTSQSTSDTATTAATTTSTTLTSGQMIITSKRQILETTTIPVPTSTLQTSRSQGTTSQSTSDTATTAATAPSTTLRHGNETSRAQSSPVTASFPTDTSASKSTPLPSKSSTTKQHSEGTTSTISTMHMGTTVPSVSASVDLIAASCAASGVVLTGVVITIVLCRRKQRRHTHFDQFLTITTGSTEEVHDTGTTTKQADTRPEHDLYSKVLPKNSRFKRGDNKECEKDTEMMDNCLYSQSKKERIDERTDDAYVENTDTCLDDFDNVKAAVCYMMENDIYCSGPATPETPVNRSLECGDMPKEKCCMIENDIYTSG